MTDLLTVKTVSAEGSAVLQKKCVSRLAPIRLFLSSQFGARNCCFGMHSRTLSYLGFHMLPNFSRLDVFLPVHLAALGVRSKADGSRLGSNAATNATSPEIRLYAFSSTVVRAQHQRSVTIEFTRTLLGLTLTPTHAQDRF